MSGRGRYDASESAIGGFVVVGIGLAMTLGFGALFVDSILDLRAFPAEPRAITVREAAALQDPPRGAWVRITDAVVDCAHAPRYGASGDTIYALITDREGGARVLLAAPGPPPDACSAWVPPLTGVLHAQSPGRIVGLDWEGVDWKRWPTPALMELWTEGGPDDAKLGLWLYPLLMLPGLLMLFGSALSALDTFRDRRARPALPAAALGHVALAMPLSTGASVLRVFGAAIGAVQIIVFGPLFLLTHFPEWMAIPLGILAAVWIFAAFGSFLDTWKRRASDLLLGDRGLAVRGGPLHRASLAWTEVDPARCAVAREGDTAALSINGELYAEASGDEDEARSLESLAATTRALALQASGAQLPPSDRASRGAVHCPSCAAPIALTLEASVRCTFCGASVPIPETAHTQLQARGRLESARGESERLLRRLLRQPGARFTNVLLALAIPPLLAGWPLAGAFFDEMYQARHVFEAIDGVAIFAAALAFTYGLSWLVRAQIAGRSAIRIIASRFAAVPPVREGEAPSCRECGASLEAHDHEQLIAVCAYCASENVLGVNLIPGAQRESHQAEDLAQELRARLAARDRHRLISLASIALLALAGTILWARWPQT